MPMLPVKNVSFYKFFKPAFDLEQARVEIAARMRALGLRGTILLAAEGINAAYAGPAENAGSFTQFLLQKIGIPAPFLKESFSEKIPFTRSLVKIKNRIVPEPGKTPLDMAKDTAPRLSPEELNRWIKEGKKMILLDTRNQYEYDLGKFSGAEHLGTEHFSDFEEDLKKAPAEWKNMPVVTFCTGGIRCEKAAPLMLKNGFREVYQLDGGILNYFEKIGRGFYEGGCFVFDGRVALDEKQLPTGDAMCFACQAILKPEDLKKPEYKEGISCHHCHGKKKSPEEPDDIV